MRKRLVIGTAAVTALFAAAAAAQTATDVNCVSCINEADIANQAVTSAKIANGSISTVDIKTNAITSDRIANQTIVMADLSLPLREALDAGITNLTVQRVTASGPSVIGASCPSDRIPVGASCECDNANGTRNLGVLFGCTVSGTGAAAGCFDEARSFNPTLPAPVAIVRAVCLGGETADGAPWNPSSAVAAAASPEQRAAAHAAWMKAEHEAFEAMLEKFRSQRAAYERQVAAK